MPIITRFSTRVDIFKNLIFDFFTRYFQKFDLIFCIWYFHIWYYKKTFTLLICMSYLWHQQANFHIYDNSMQIRRWFATWEFKLNSNKKSFLSFFSTSKCFRLFWYLICTKLFDDYFAPDFPSCKSLWQLLMTSVYIV